MKKISSLDLITEAIKKQLDQAGKNIKDAIPDKNKLLEAIKKENNK